VGYTRSNRKHCQAVSNCLVLVLWLVCAHEKVLTLSVFDDRRCFNLLGLDEYYEELADGLQILRYNLTTAYTPHLDYLEDTAGTESYDYDSAGKGGNRFATILLYFTDLGVQDGGETVFPRAFAPGVAEENRVELKDAIAQLRASGDAPMLVKGSWEEEMTAQCRTRLAIRPQATRAVLFYSQVRKLLQMIYVNCPWIRTYLSDGYSS
jgi:prolyl 4-hydroxylase